MTVAVVGAGWAGLAAALALHRQGHAVHLFESSHQAGGRARTVHLAPGRTLDNGQHILLGAYTHTLELMRSLGCDPDQLLRRLPLTLECPGTGWALRSPAWPAPLHALGALLSAHGPTLGERLLAGLPLLIPARTAQARPGSHTSTHHPHASQSAPPENNGVAETVAQWLMRCRQSPAMVRAIWAPLCLAALNTPVDQACALMFRRVLRDALLGPAHHSHMMVPRSDLSALWPDAAVRELQAGPANAVHFGHTVRHLAYENNAPCDTARRNHTRVQVDGEPFDAVIVATPPPSAARLLGTLVSANARSYPMPVPGLDQNQNSHRHRQGHSTPQDQSRWLGCLAAFNFLPIATVTLTLEHPWPDPAAMLMLDENPAHGHYGQWLFNHYHLNPRWKDRLAVVISDARQFAQADENTAVQGIVHQIRTQTAARRHALPLVREHKVIIEKRATFAAVPGLWRPENTTPWPGILVAGDWTNTGYPSVLEGAVRSGQNAARRLIENSRQRMPAAV